MIQKIGEAVRKLRRLRVGQKPSCEDFNELVDKVNAFGNITGSGGIHASVGPQGIMLRGKRPKREVRKAFCKNAAGGGNTIVCWLSETDNEGPEITVTCNIVPGTDLNESAPRLADGTPIFVKFVNDVWECVQTFSGSEDCDCYLEA